MADSKKENTYQSYDEYPTFSGEWIEMKYTPQYTTFMLWAPTADAVKVNIYDQGAETPAILEMNMTECDCGQWKCDVLQDLKGLFYTFSVYFHNNWLGETPGLMAKAVGINGLRAAIIDMHLTNPEGWETDNKPELKDTADSIIYELHHRDFSICPNSGIHHKGKFLALTESWSESPYGHKTGISHLKELGITHVHLLPSFDYATVDESKPNDLQYNWGYDPLNYNVPEGSYATDPYDPATRIIEFKQMVQALHRAGIRVIMDMVYNHTYYNDESNFERTVPGYFYRHTPDGGWANGSGCHNETASERTMMRKFMIDSVTYWAKEFHIDGFRFDLMGIHDIETMNTIRKALDEIDPTVMMYGEGWAGCPPSYPFGKLAMKVNTNQMKGIASFSDEFRDGLKAFSISGEKAVSTDEIQRQKAMVMFGITGALPHPQLKDSLKYYPQTWAVSPTQMIAYVSCHDDYCIEDFFRTSLPDTDATGRDKLLKLVETALFTSQGIPFLFAGDEMMRTKKCVKNSYNSPDTVNWIDWRWKKEHIDAFTYIRNLISLRKAHPAFRLGEASLVYQYLEFLSTEDGIIAFRLNGRPKDETWQDITVILNANKKRVEVEVPVGNYRIVCHDGNIEPTNGIFNIDGTFLSAEPQSATIAYRKESID